ncbi:uncharacterized protein LOC111071766 [Drosophila obscura]|uniref:uncharacterized protein LOC111071766 n=1 Tax=Drosophila obscura TaxID=7282 RepID=UPI001BB10717|nr:uncharacterized protein LOC111071766 [Drosophila obscura]
MDFFPGRDGLNDLNSLKKLKSLDASLWCSEEEEFDEENDKLLTDFVCNLKQFPSLRKLTLFADSYSGRGLHVLNQLEYLEVNTFSKFDDKILTDCFQTMKQLRHLDINYPNTLTENNLEMLVTSCQQLERLVLHIEHSDSSEPYELVCQLPTLQHLQVDHGGILRDSLIEGLINKKGSPMESLILGPDELPVDQVKRLCNISTLKELEVACNTVPLEDLLKLKNLLYLHISMPITDDQALNILKGLPHLKALNILEDSEIDQVNLVNSVRTWVSGQKEQRGKIKIYLNRYIKYTDSLVEFKFDHLEPILINKELIERDQN